MPLGAQLPIRLEFDVDKRLTNIANRIGTSKSALIRLLVETFVDHAIKPDGTIVLPPNWTDLLPKADARSNGNKDSTSPTANSGDGADYNSKQAASKELRRIRKSRGIP